MAIAVLFKYDPDTGKTTTDVFQTPEHDDRGQGFSPRITSLGRYFHRLADAIEWGVL